MQFLPELETQALLVRRLQQSGSELTMNFDCEADDLPRQQIMIMWPLGQFSLCRCLAGGYVGFDTTKECLREGAAGLIDARARLAQHLGRRRIRDAEMRR